METTSQDRADLDRYTGVVRLYYNEHGERTEASRARHFAAKDRLREEWGEERLERIRELYDLRYESCCEAQEYERVEAQYR